MIGRFLRFGCVGLTMLAVSGFYYVYYVRKKWEKSSEDIEDCNIARAKFKWTIKNLSFRTGMRETFSNPFSDGYNVWQLLLYRNGSTSNISIYLILVNSYLPESHAKFQCSTSLSPNVRYHDVCKFEISKREHGFDTLIFYLENKRIFDEQLKDTLVIYWEVHSLIYNNTPPIKKLEERDIFINLERLFSEKQFCDITFIVDEVEFHAHKIIMGSVSEVFEAMFSSGMIEETEGIVQIEDIDSATFGEMLRHIYTGKANFGRHAQGLLMAADKYGIQILKLQAEDYLIKDLKVENSAATLAMADLYSAPALKGKAINFIDVNKSEVIKTSGWKQIKTSHPQIVADLYALSSQQNKVFNNLRI